MKDEALKTASRPPPEAGQSTQSARRNAMKEKETIGPISRIRPIGPITFQRTASEMIFQALFVTETSSPPLWSVIDSASPGETAAASVTTAPVADFAVML